MASSIIHLAITNELLNKPKASICTLNKKTFASSNNEKTPKVPWKQGISFFFRQQNANRFI